MFYYRPPGGQFQPLDGAHVIINGAGAQAFTRINAMSARLDAARARIAQATASLIPVIAEPVQIYTGADGEFYATQGGCGDGQYYYYFQQNNNESPGSLVKVDMATFTVVARASLTLGHGNDMTYCPDDGMLYVSGGQGDSAYHLYKISSSTLELVETITLTEPVFSIAYDRVNKRFFGIGYNRVFRIFDEHLNMLTYSPDPNKNPSPCIANEWTSQGSECDNLFIYHCWTKSVNGVYQGRIEIFDWQANYIGYADVSNGTEMEHCFRIGNTMYVGYNYGGEIRLQRCKINGG